MDMAGDHHRRLILHDPLHQLHIAEKALAAPAGRRISRRRVVRPDPSLRTVDRSITQLVGDALLDPWSIPPRAHREQRVADGHSLAIADDAKRAHLRYP